jgi:hypothetical protein
MPEPERQALEAAARDALHAPSVFNTQPWARRIEGNALELRADPDRQLPTVDRDGHFLLLSCGAALHHARVALGAGGWLSEVERLRPSAGDVARGRATARPRRGHRRPTRVVNQMQPTMVIDGADFRAGV